MVLAAPDARFAMGIFSHENAPCYGRFRFKIEHAVRWSCVFRPLVAETGIAPGKYSFRHFVVVGDLAAVRESLRALQLEFAGK